MLQDSEMCYKTVRGVTRECEVLQDSARCYKTVRGVTRE